MAGEIGVNFRSTSVYIADGTGFAFIGGDPYPTTRAITGGPVDGVSNITAGFSTTPGLANRTTSYGPKLAGINHRSNASATITFTIDLPKGAGTYNLRLAAGDNASAQGIKLVFKDGTGGSTLFTLNSTGTVPAGSALDAMGTVHTFPNWAANNVARSVTFTSTKLEIVVGGHSDTASASILSSLSLDFVSGADTTPPTITGPGGSTGSTSSITVNENQTTVHTFTASETVTWDLNGGADVAKFAINSSTGALTFLAAPDFEAPGDADTNNTYIVGVRATDTASNATTQTCTVTVADVADTPPTAPTIGATSSITSSGATINWTDNSSDETSFQVQIETPSGANNWTNASSGSANPTAANVTSLAINGLSASTEYRARVRASNGAGSSAWSTGTAFTTSASGGGVGPLLLLLQQQA